MIEIYLFFGIWFSKKLENLFEITKFLLNFVPKKNGLEERKKNHWCIVVVVIACFQNLMSNMRLACKWVYFQWRRTATIFVKANFCCHVHSDFNNGGTRQGGPSVLKSAKSLKEFLSVLLTWCYNVTMPSPLACFVCFRQVCGGRPQGTASVCYMVGFSVSWGHQKKTNKFISAASLHSCISTLPPPLYGHIMHSGNALVGWLWCTYFQGFVPDFLRFF